MWLKVHHVGHEAFERLQDKVRSHRGQLRPATLQQFISTTLQHCKTRRLVSFHSPLPTSPYNRSSRRARPSGSPRWSSVSTRASSARRSRWVPCRCTSSSSSPRPTLRAATRGRGCSASTRPPPYACYLVITPNLPTRLLCFDQALTVINWEMQWSEGIKVRPTPTPHPRP